MIDPDDVFPDILTLLRCRAALHPDAPALECVTHGETLTYGSLLERVEAEGRALLAAGGRRIAIVLPNGGEMSATLLAAACAGTALPFNPALTEAEFAAYFGETHVDLLIAVPDLSQGAMRVAQSMGLPTFSPQELVAAGSQSAPLPVPVPEATAMVLLTSGSTGRAKRAPLSHRNVLTSARDVARSIDLRPQDRCLSMWELFHVGGLVDLLLAPLHSGGVVIATPGFEVRRFYRLLHEKHPTWFQGVPTTLGEILSQRARVHPVLSGSSLRLLRSVAAPLAPARLAELEAAFGVPVIQTFGMTEAGPLITATGLAPGDRVAGSVGRSCGCEVRALSPDGRDVTTGEEGELAVRGPNVFAGYEDDPAANAAAFSGGWFRTGDLGRFDAAGNLFLTGRLKDLVNRGGEKINLREVDDALAAHPSIFEAASFGAPHPTLGEDIAAAVVLRAGADWDVSEVYEHLGKRLARFKLPARIIVMDSLPRNAVGKIDRIALAAQMEGSAASPGPDPSANEELEAGVAAIWAQELGLAWVAPDADFAALGGDSLAALRVFLALEQRYGALPPELVARKPDTVRSVARQIAGFLARGSLEGADVPATQDMTFTAAHRSALLAVIAAGRVPALRPGSSLKVVNRDGSKPPVIWFFNAPNAEMFALANRMSSDQPLYGGYSCANLFEWTDPAIHGLARAYAAELLQEFPEGPFRLGGNCQGGRLAWLITQRLEAAGRRVESLAFLEYSEPDLTRFSGRILMMFGMHSDMQHYRPIRWGAYGWERPFARRPVAVWIPGAHGRFFEPQSVGALAASIRNFFEGNAIPGVGMRSVRGRTVWLIHKNSRLFAAFAGRYLDKNGWPRPLVSNKGRP